MEYFERTGTLPNSIGELVDVTIGLETQQGVPSSPAAEVEEFLQLVAVSMKWLRLIAQVWAESIILASHEKYRTMPMILTNWFTSSEENL